MTERRGFKSLKEERLSPNSSTLDAGDKFERVLANREQRPQALYSQEAGGNPPVQSSDPDTEDVIIWVVVAIILCVLIYLIYKYWDSIKESAVNLKNKFFPGTQGDIARKGGNPPNQEPYQAPYQGPYQGQDYKEKQNTYNAYYANNMNQNENVRGGGSFAS